MKTYCLTDKAYKQVKGYTKTIGMLFIVFIITTTIAGMIIVAFNLPLNKSSLLDTMVYYSGFIGWIIAIVYMTKMLINWLRNSIIICDDKN